MNLKEFVQQGNSSPSLGLRSDTEITTELLENNLDRYRELIAYWRIYPDHFIDYMCSLDPDCNFKFFFYQRLCKKGPLFREK